MAVAVTAAVPGQITARSCSLPDNRPNDDCSCSEVAGYKPQALPRSAGHCSAVQCDALHVNNLATHTCVGWLQASCLSSCRQGANAPLTAAMSGSWHRAAAAPAATSSHVAAAPVSRSTCKQRSAGVVQLQVVTQQRQAACAVTTQQATLSANADDLWNPICFST